MTTRQLTINLTALRNNFDQIHRLTPHCAVLSMVKANAYGHGLVTVARALTRSDAFGVATLSEALSLREAGIAQRIVLMAGFLDLDELKVMAAHKIEAVIHQVEQIRLIESAQITPPVWLKINIGMNRLGFRPEEAMLMYQRLLACYPNSKVIPIIAHFPSIEDHQHQCLTLDQYHTFRGLIHHHPNPSLQSSLMQSAGILKNQFKQLDGEWIRPGISLYGISPLPGHLGYDHGLQPVMTLRAQLMAIQNVKRGDYVGYGSTWCSPSNKRIGIVSIGYGDGYPRSAPTGTPVLIHDIECPLVGRVSMDMLAVDLSLCPQATLGSIVTLWGEGLPIERIAKAAHTIPYELLCQVTTRVERSIT